MGVVFNIQRYCLHDGDGIRTTVFFKGCPLRCIWCHNPEGFSPSASVSYNGDKCTLCGRCVDGCEGRVIREGQMELDRRKCTFCGNCVAKCIVGANEIFGKELSVKDVLDVVLKDKIYYKTSGGGMTLSGGEPSMQAEFALDLIEGAKAEGIGTCVETCGIGSREFYSRANDFGVTFLFDIKCIDSDRHLKLTGVSNERIISNLEFLFENEADVVVRLPMIPGINDKEEDINALCCFLKKYEGKYRKAEIMAYHSYGVAKAKRLGNEEVFFCKDATDEDKARWVEAFSKCGVNVKISQ